MAKEISFQDFMVLAKEVLENDTPYSRNRNAIDSLFNMNVGLPYKQTVFIRLAVIDSLYSTNMNKHIGGLENLANSINKISNNDEELKIKIRKYKVKIKDCKEKNQMDVEFLLDGKYGKGQHAAKARSLISKYFYFLMKHQFPIEDNLLKNYINEVDEYFKLNLDFHPYSKCEDKSNLLVKLLKFEKIDGQYDSFDNLVWLYGKIREGSFSLISNDAGSKRITKKNASERLKVFWILCDRIKRLYEKNHPKAKDKTET
ncbi:MAG: hypothetical protein J6Y14_08245 [Fibrobacter sp.]|nr:hypothetical protein [Fibrobacter sp.]